MQAKGIPKNFWQSVPNQRAFFDNVAKDLNVQHPSDWYKINRYEIEKRGGSAILRAYYNNSLIQALHHVYPEHHSDWMVWKFGKVPKDYWRDLSNQRTFFDWAAEQLNISDPSQWYNTNMNQIQKLGGSSLLYSYYGNSLVRAVTSVYPEYPWKIWLFHQVPRGFWNKESNIISYLQWLSEQLGVKRVEDWLYISRDQLESTGAATLLDRTGGFRSLLERYFPEISKALSTAGKRPRKTLQHLRRIVTQIFPKNSKIQTDYRHPKLLFPSTNREMEFDIFVTIDNNMELEYKDGFMDSKKIFVALEYQGEQHYMWHYLYGSPDVQKSRDEEKMQVCRKAGIHLVQVPFWWDRSKSSLIATIAKYYPDVFRLLELPPEDIKLLNTGGILPIPQEMPAQFLKKRSFHPQVSSPEEFFKASSHPYPYRIRLGRSGGISPKCRSCRKILDSDELRIEARGVYAPPGSPPYPAKYSFCTSPSCIRSVITKSRGESQAGVHLPPWESNIGISPSLMANLDLEQFKELGIQLEPVE